MDCEKSSAYSISLRIINLLEKKIFFGVKKSSKKNILLLELKKIIQNKLPKWFKSILDFLIQKIELVVRLILTPFLLFYFGIKSSIISYYTIFLILFIIISFVFGGLSYFQFPLIGNENVFSSVICLLFLIDVLFKKIPSHGKKENDLIQQMKKDLVFFDLNKEQWGYVKDNINLFHTNSSKRIRFITSFITFIWTIYLLIFKLFQANLSELNGVELFNLIKKPLLIYSSIFILIRLYSKVYKHIFEIINLSINEVLFNDEMSK